MFFSYNEYDSFAGAAVGGLLAACFNLGAIGILGCSGLGMIFGAINLLRVLSYLPSPGSSYGSNQTPHSSKYSSNDNSGSSWTPNQSSATVSSSATATNQSVTFDMF